MSLSSHFKKQQKEWDTMKSRWIVPALTAALLSSFSLALAAGGNLPFTDVPSGSWYREYVRAAWENGLINGVAEHSFAPDGTLSLSQAVTLAARMHQLDQEGTVTLVNGEDIWYAPYVDYAEETGIIEREYYAGRWEETATRSEFIEIFYSAFPASEYTEINIVDDGAIPDVHPSQSYGPEVYAFYRAGILTGDENFYFHPNAAITRSEVSAIMARMFTPSLRSSVELRSKQTSPDPLTPVPNLDAALTFENVMALLSNYDPDGAFIMQSCHDQGDDVMVWWWGNAGLMDCLGTAVHEECHSYLHGNGGWNKEAIYIGSGEHLVVEYTDVVPSTYMAATIPESLRTFRWRDYVGEPDAGMASNVDGPYGLLNEFTAYCWGCNDDVSMLDYYLTQPQSAENWLDYVQNAAGSISAYAEFRYYILHYMLYVREQYPDVYANVMANEAFLDAFTIIENKYASVVATYLANLERVRYAAEDMGLRAFQSGDAFFIGNRGVGMNLEDYDLLMTEMEKPEYQQMLDLLMQ